MFNNAYCTAPLSGPSRGAMFTGHYPDAVGLSVNGSPIPDSLRRQTLGTLIKNAGYDCAYGGKWHLPLLDVPTKNTASTTFTNIVTTDWRKLAPNTSHANIKSLFPGSFL
jgi:arylsulfatase A-like enzyme